MMFEHSYSEADETNVPSASSYDPVNVPLHYNHGKIEVINVIMALGFDNCEGNVSKYVMRHRFKNGIEDIEKSIRYVQLMIDNHDDWYDETQFLSEQDQQTKREEAIHYCILLNLNHLETECVLLIQKHKFTNKIESLYECESNLKMILKNYRQWYD